jgi:hypothetical protein|tara:strand:- start:78 stop:239 length:162 start_codon:yes stop_codon:yes gene_type:complete
MNENLKDTVIVKSFNMLQDLKNIVETQQLQLNILVDDNILLKQRIKNLEEKLK